MPRLNGIEAARRLRKLLPEAKIIFVTQHSDAPYVAAARKMGAAGYVLKQSAASELLQAIEAVKSGRRYFATPVNRVPRDSLLAGGSRLRAGIQEYAGEDRAAGARARRPKQDSSE